MGFIYRTDIDAIKGWAICAVMLFHYGLVKSGYLGVDAFFVINGFFIIPSVLKGIKDGNFSYYLFLEKRIIRLLPLVLILCLSSLVLGCVFMLPFELERTARSVVASCLMSENLRCAFTFGNYWEILNDYSPLFHMWYVGILFEFYLTYPLLMIAISKFKRKDSNIMEIGTIILFLFSLILYLLPMISSIDQKFYLLPFRFFEIAAGGLVAIYIRKRLSDTSLRSKWNIMVLVALIVVIFSSVFTIYHDGIGHQVNPIAAYSIGLTLTGLHYSPTFLLILTVILTSIALYRLSEVKGMGLLIWLGKRSYSLFIWHQFVLAFYRNIISDEITIFSTVVYFFITIVLSELTYRYVEQKIVPCKRTFFISIVSSLLLVTSASYIYVNGGVIKDIPELELKRGEGFVGAVVAYVDIPNDYNDKPFPSNAKKNVLILGNSFARDFCNILRESKYGDKLNFSYSSDLKVSLNPVVFKKADYIFSFLSKELMTDSVMKRLKPGCKIYGIGTKNFGNSNNQFYSHRWSDDYFNSVTLLPKEYKTANEISKKHWGDAYIDLIGPAMVDSSYIRVFTPDHKYISQDCRHLTPAGARWYASVLKLDEIFE